MDMHFNIFFLVFTGDFESSAVNGRFGSVRIFEMTKAPHGEGGDNCFAGVSVSCAVVPFPYGASIPH